MTIEPAGQHEAKLSDMRPRISPLSLSPRVLLAAALLAAHSPVGSLTAVAAEPAPVVDAGVRGAVAQGRARVIVELRVPGGVQPEGTLAGPGAVAAQRSAIASVQAEVLARLGGTAFFLVRRYASTPHLALEIAPDALAALETMGNLVARIVRDLPRAPTRPSTPPG